MRFSVLYNPYCQEGRFVFPLPGHWAICIFGKPIGSNKELSNEIMDFDLDKCCFEVMLFCSCDQFKHYWIKWTANQPQRNFLGVLGNYVLYNSQKDFVPIAQLYLLLLSLSGALWCIGGVVGYASGYTWHGIFPTATDLLENLILENCHDEKNRLRKENWFGCSETNPQIVICFLGALFQLTSILYSVHYN